MVDIVYKQIDDVSIPYWAGSFPDTGQFLFSRDNITYRWNFTDQRLLFFDNPNFTGVVNVPTAPVAPSNRAANTRWVIDYVGALGLGLATSSTFGTVRTNTDSSTPTVYLKAEVDALNAAVRPIAAGGTQANTASGARQNLDAAKAGVNSDITSLTALASIPALIQSAINTLIPSGVCLPYLGDAIPPGFIAGLNQVLSRADYPGIFAAIGTKYGNGNNDGLSFTMPSLVDVFPIGAHPTHTPAGGQSRLVGSTGGVNSFNLSSNQLTPHVHATSISASEGNHTHTGTTLGAGSHEHTGTIQSDGTHKHLANFRRTASFASGSGVADFLTPTFTNSSSSVIEDAGVHNHGLTINTAGSHLHTLSIQNNDGSHSHGVTTESIGGGQPINNMPKFIGVMLIVKI